MMTAATVSRRLVLRTRDCRRSSGVAPLEATSGIMLTPVSNPERPRTSSGNASNAGRRMPLQPPPPDVIAVDPVVDRDGVCRACRQGPTMMIAALSRGTPPRGGWPRSRPR